MNLDLTGKKKNNCAEALETQLSYCHQELALPNFLTVTFKWPGMKKIKRNWQKFRYFKETKTMNIVAVFKFRKL